MSAKTPVDERMFGAAPEDELLRLERSYRDLAMPKMRPIIVQAPDGEPAIRTGDAP